MTEKLSFPLIFQIADPFPYRKHFHIREKYNNSLSPSKNDDFNFFSIYRRENSQFPTRMRKYF